MRRWGGEGRRGLQEGKGGTMERNGERETVGVVTVCSLPQADQRFVWNGHLLRDFMTQPEVVEQSALYPT